MSFHDDSYGYRPGRGALDAVAKCRERCWSTSWVIDLDVRKFFDSVAWDLMVEAVEANVTHEQRWIVLYVKRWLAAPIRTPEGRVVERDRGTPQGSAITPPTQWAMSGLVTLRVGVVGVSSVVGGAFSRMGMRWRMVILSGPMRTSLTSSRSTRWRSSMLEASALVRSWVRKLSRSAASSR